MSPAPEDLHRMRERLRREPEPTRPMPPVADFRRHERALLLDQARHQRQLGLDVVITPGRLIELLDEIDDLERDIAAMTLLEQLPNETQRCVVVCHPAFTVKSRVDHLNGTVTIVIVRRPAA